MHHFRRRSQLIFHRLNAVSWLVLLVLSLVTAGLLGTAFFTNDPSLALAGLSCACVALALAFLQRLAAGSASCPLCRMPPLGSRACQKNSRARPLLGSHRLRVSISTLLLNRFRCPYCGEPTRCTVKTRPPEDSSHRQPPLRAVLTPFR